VTWRSGTVVERQSLNGARRPLLGDARSAVELVEGLEAAVVEEEDAVGDVADVGELVSRDDERLSSVVLANDERWARVTARTQGIVDEEETVGVRWSIGRRLRFDE